MLANYGYQHYAAIYGPTTWHCAVHMFGMLRPLVAYDFLRTGPVFLILKATLEHRILLHDYEYWSWR